MQWDSSNAFLHGFWRKTLHELHFLCDVGEINTQCYCSSPLYIISLRAVAWVELMSLNSSTGFKWLLISSVLSLVLLKVVQTMAQTALVCVWIPADSCCGGWRCRAIGFILKEDSSSTCGHTKSCLKVSLYLSICWGRNKGPQCKDSAAQMSLQTFLSCYFSSITSPAIHSPAYSGWFWVLGSWSSTFSPLYWVCGSSPSETHSKSLDSSARHR